jgi:hypothetical protein
MASVGDLQARWMKTYGIPRCHSARESDRLLISGRCSSVQVTGSAGSLLLGCIGHGTHVVITPVSERRRKACCSLNRDAHRRENFFSRLFLAVSPTTSHDTWKAHLDNGLICASLLLASWFVSKCVRRSTLRSHGNRCPCVARLSEHV